MNMKVIVTESQYKIILNEGLMSKISKQLEDFNNFTKKIISDVKNAYNFHIRFGLTYGAGIGAILEPIMNFLNEKSPELSKGQMQMIALAAISIVFFESKQLNELKRTIRDENLGNELAQTISYVSIIKQKLKKILELIGLSVYRATDIISYAFLLPLLTELNKLINLDMQSINYDLISKTILSATGIMLSGLIIKRMTEKLLK